MALSVASPRPSWLALSLSSHIPAAQFRSFLSTYSTLPSSFSPHRPFPPSPNHVPLPLLRAPQVTPLWTHAVSKADLFLLPYFACLIAALGGVAIDRDHRCVRSLLPLSSPPTTLQTSLMVSQMYFFFCTLSYRIVS